MSDERQLPTVEQIDAKVSECYQRVGLLDAEWRKVVEPYNEMGQRLQKIEAEKAELHRLIGNLEYTREQVTKEEDSTVEVSEGEADDSENKD